jgi:hypothetical protein
MAAIVNIPREVFSKEIVRHLDDKGTHRLSQVSTQWLAIVQRALKYPQENITLEGRKGTISLVTSADGTIVALLLQKRKMAIIANDPNFFEYISSARTAVSMVGGNPDDIVTLFKHAIVEKAEITVREAAVRLVLFDLHTKLIPASGRYGLGHALIKSIMNSESRFTGAILCHPNAPKIPVDDGEYGLGIAFNLAFGEGSEAAVLSLPNASNFSGDALGETLHTAIVMNDPERVKVVCSHQNYNKIPAEGESGLGKCLRMSVRMNNSLFVRLILKHPNAQFIPAKDLNRALEEGKYAHNNQTNPEIVKAINAFLEKDNPKNTEDHAQAIVPRTNNPMRVREVPTVEEIVIPPTDQDVLLQLQDMLTAEVNYTSEDYLDLLESLSAETQHLICELLCKAHGYPTGHIVYDGFAHVRHNPLRLLFIIPKLT